MHKEILNSSEKTGKPSAFIDKTAASVVLKLFINGTVKYHTINARERMCKTQL